MVDERPVFRSGDKYQLLQYREYIRNHPQSPLPRDGYVVEDLDMLIRGFGPRFQTDDLGKFVEIELKFGRKWLTYGQLKTFGLRDRLMRQGDPAGKHYLGFYVINYSDDDWKVSDFWINRKAVGKTGLDKFLLLQDIGVPPLDFKEETDKYKRRGAQRT